jgi:serine/threonine-protein kinase HipA
MNCKICLGPVEKNDQAKGYHTVCIKKLLGSPKVSPVLDFSKKEFMAISRDKSQGMSISGVQKKLSMLIMKDKIVPADNQGTHILKPTPFEYPEASENEHLTMLIGAALGIETPPLGLVSFNDGELAYIIKRFDRIDSQGKIHQEDLAQAMGVIRDANGEYKYSRSYEEAASLIYEASGRKLAPVLRFFERLLFNYLICNGDYHLKNTSLMRKPGNKTGFYDGLSPNYDCLQTKFYFPQETDMALDLFKDDYLSESLQLIGFATKKDFIEFGKRILLTDPAIENAIRKIESKTSNITALIQRSFLSVEKKQFYRQQLEERCKRLIQT